MVGKCASWGREAEPSVPWEKSHPDMSSKRKTIRSRALGLPTRSPSVRDSTRDENAGQMQGAHQMDAVAWQHIYAHIAKAKAQSQQRQALFQR